MKKLILSIIVFLVFISSASAYSNNITEFINNLKSENITFGGSSNITRYMDVYNYVYVIDINITLKGTNFTICYQETANVSSSCGGLDGGIYNGTSIQNDVYLAHDGDWTASSSSYNIELEINYTKPNNAVGAIWMFREEVGEIRDRTNVTINASCWSAYPDMISLRVDTEGSGLSKWAVYQCHTGSQWINVSKTFLDSVSNDLVEEAIFWNISSLINPYIEIGTPDGSYEWSYTGSFNKTQNVTLTTTTINDILQNDCNCTNCSQPNAYTCRVPFQFHSNSSGTLEYSNIFLNYSFAVDNCSGSHNIDSNATGLNITFRDEVSNNPITTTNFDYYLSYELNSQLNSSVLSGDIDLEDSFQWCIYPNWLRTAIDFDVEYSASGYDKRTYNQRNLSLTNTTTYLTLYLLSEGNSTLITVIVHDDFGDAMPDIVVEAWRYSLVDNTYIFAGSEETDNDGEVEFYLDVSKKHQFVVKNQDGEIIYTSLTMKLFDTTYTFTVLSAITTVMNDMVNLDRILTVPSSSPYAITYTWDDPTNLISQICLDITNQTVHNKTSIYSACSSASSGTLSYTLTVTDGYYVVVGSAYATADGNRYVLDSEIIEIRTAYDVFGSEGMLLSALFVGTVTFIGLPIAAVSASGGVIVIIFMLFSSILMVLMGMMNIGMSGITLLAIMSIAVVIMISKED